MVELMKDVHVPFTFESRAVEELATVVHITGHKGTIPTLLDVGSAEDFICAVCSV
jgi:hypothetical protein